ncbi:hypothetical protein DIJ64_05520 [Mycobacterium leprae]|uniref:Uncharacterized protein n=1 Tax=Mycobacterium leprae TaxID=1769 RepID=A0AAD0KQH9_MYCLR|nr:hypothetical protein DIJ64_05520 [Mycobacterium leprae]OAR21439.1 hypothetical protein A8144_05880 [Mycobacterium leprae 3125609]OAX71302.1 hypothetical protein A3216_06785 [Mycobacterium leprae 7935681]
MEVVMTNLLHRIGCHLDLILVSVTLGTLLIMLVRFTISLSFGSISDWFLSATIPLAVMNLAVL